MSTDSIESSGVAKAWQEGYRQGVLDERASEDNIGIAGFCAKVEPARNNPYALAQQPASSAPVGDSLLQTALRNLPQYISKSGLVGPDMHSAMQCFEVLRDALAQQPAAEDGTADFEIHAGGEYFASVSGQREQAWKEVMHYVSTLSPEDGEPEVFEVTRHKVFLAAAHKEEKSE